MPCFGSSEGTRGRQGEYPVNVNQGGNNSENKVNVAGDEVSVSNSINKVHETSFKLWLPSKEIVSMDQIRPALNGYSGRQKEWSWQREDQAPS